MCKGESVYFGPARDVHDYFASIGVPIPPDYNPADYLVRPWMTTTVAEQLNLSRKVLILGGLLVCLQIDIIFTYGDEPMPAEGDEVRLKEGLMLRPQRALLSDCFLTSLGSVVRGCRPPMST
jgi:hypothetical protein